MIETQLHARVRKIDREDRVPTRSVPKNRAAGESSGGSARRRWRAIPDLRRRKPSGCGRRAVRWISALPMLIPKGKSQSGATNVGEYTRSGAAGLAYATSVQASGGKRAI